ncbi:MAG: tetratricopeptide repeat protein [Opitutales bacterium]|nr:tetratricopeptide repeat protein [Opitutales bacterium]
MSKQKKSQDPVEKAILEAQNKESELPPDADVEERFNEFWKKNGFGIFVGIALGAVLVLGFQISAYVSAQRESNIQTAYLALETPAERAAFAEEHSRHPLAGMAWLELADAAYDEGDYSAALDSFERAARALEGTPVGGRARLGAAMSELMLDRREDAKVALNVIASDGRLLVGTRAEAAYHLAVIHWEDENLSAMEESLDLIHDLEGASLWAFRANVLRQRVPAIDVVEVDEPVVDQPEPLPF